MSTRIVTFLSDFGDEDHYSAAVKASLLGAKSIPQIIDISHRITPFDIGHAAYVIRSCFRQFPKGSIHLIALDPADKSDMKGLVASIEDHIFVCSDNGILSLISENTPDNVMEVDGNHSSFFTKDVLIPIVIKLLNEEPMENIGKTTENYIKLFNRLPKVTKREIVGNIIRIDTYGNLITNIKKEDFEKIREINGQVPFRVQFGRESYQKLHNHYADVESGDSFVLFNSNGLLQIGINKGNASQLLGLRFEAPVFIEFEVKDAN